MYELVQYAMVMFGPDRYKDLKRFAKVLTRLRRYIERIPVRTDAFDTMYNEWLKVCNGKTSSDEDIEFLVYLIQKYGVPREWFENMFKAARKELRDPHNATFDKLDGYLSDKMDGPAKVLCRILRVHPRMYTAVCSLARGVQLCRYTLHIEDSVSRKITYFPDADFTKCNLSNLDKKYTDTRPVQFLQFTLLQDKRYQEYCSELRRKLSDMPWRQRVLFTQIMRVHQYRMNRLLDRPSRVYRTSFKPSWPVHTYYFLKHILFS